MNSIVSGIRAIATSLHLHNVQHSIEYFTIWKPLFLPLAVQIYGWANERMNGWFNLNYEGGMEVGIGKERADRDELK